MLRAVGMTRTLWMHPFVPGTAAPHDSGQLAPAARLQAARAPFSTRQAARKGARPSPPRLSAERDEPPPRLEELRALASHTAASAARGAKDTARRAPGVSAPCGRRASAASASGKVGAGSGGGARGRRQGSGTRVVPRLCSRPVPTLSLRTPAALPTFWMVCCVTSPLPLGRADAKATDMVAARTQSVIIGVYSPAAPRGPRCPFSAERGRGRGGCRAVGSPACLLPMRARASRVPAP